VVQCSLVIEHVKSQTGQLRVNLAASFPNNRNHVEDDHIDWVKVLLLLSLYQ